MKVRLGVVAAVVFYCAAAGVVWGQDLDPQIRKITDGIYVYVGKNLNSNAGIVLTQVGDRTFELRFLKSVHSEADTAIWLPKERVVFAAASVGVKRFSNLRPFVKIYDTLEATKMMKTLNPEVVVPGHGAPGTVKILEDMEKYYNLLMEGVGAMVKAGKSLDEIKKELKIPGTEEWAGKDRYPNNIEAAYRAVKGK